MEDLKSIIAKNIMLLRKKCNFTQAEFAEKLNYSDKAISKWERAESIPDVIVLKQIADLFEVSVDYLIEEHKEEEIKKTTKSKHNKLLITLLAVSPIWIIATIAFCLTAIIANKYIWLVYVISVPLSSIVLIVFNSIWGVRKNNFYIISVLVWGIIISIYCMFLKSNLWLLFILGIPAQIVIIIWSRIK